MDEAELDAFNIQQQEEGKIQGSKGIRQWSINCNPSLMMIHKMKPSLDKN